MFWHLFISWAKQKYFFKTFVIVNSNSCEKEIDWISEGTEKLLFGMQASLAFWDFIVFKCQHCLLQFLIFTITHYQSHSHRTQHWKCSISPHSLEGELLLDVSWRKPNWEFLPLRKFVVVSEAMLSWLWDSPRCHQHPWAGDCCNPGHRECSSACPDMS